MNIKFSIITVCYNSEKTIERTLKSLINQKEKNFELIIVDGKSTDETLNIINKYSSEFKNIKIISEPDKGIYDAMNKGIDLSEGEIISFLNSDDFYEVDTLDIVKRNFTNDIDILYGDTYLIDYFDGNYYEKKSDFVNVKELTKGRMIPHTSTFVRAELMKKYKFDINYRIAADYKFILKMYLLNKSFKYIEYRLTNMLLGGASNTQILKFEQEWDNVRGELIEGYKINSKKVKLQTYKRLLKEKIWNIMPRKVVREYRYIRKGWTIYEDII